MAELFKQRKPRRYGAHAADEDHEEGTRRQAHRRVMSAWTPQTALSTFRLSRAENDGACRRLDGEGGAQIGEIVLVLCYNARPEELRAGGYSCLTWAAKW